MMDIPHNIYYRSFPFEDKESPNVRASEGVKEWKDQARRNLARKGVRQAGDLAGHDYHTMGWRGNSNSELMRNQWEF